MTRMGNEMIKELSAILGGIKKTASAEVEETDTLVLIQKMAETATALDEAGEAEAASAVDDALRVIMRDLNGKAVSEEAPVVVEEEPVVAEAEPEISKEAEGATGPNELYTWSDDSISEYFGKVLDRVEKLEQQMTQPQRGM